MSESEFKSAPVVMGSECEHSLMLRGMTPSELADFSGEVTEAITSVSSSSRYWNYDGSSLYMDTGVHPEWAGPECLSGRDVALYERVSQEQMALRCARMQSNWRSRGRDVSVYLYRNNAIANGQVSTSQFDPSWGYHMNFMVPRSFRTRAFMLDTPLLAFLATGIIWWGTGKVVPDPESEVGYKLQLSQRAPYFSLEYAKNSTLAATRGLIHYKQEDVSQNCLRLQLASTDTNMLDRVTELKFDSIALLITMIIENRVQGVRLASPPTNGSITIDAAVAAMQAVNVNRDVQLPIFGSSRTMTAREIQWQYFLEMKDFVTRTGTSERWGRTILWLEDMLRREAMGISHLVGYNDLGTKWRLIEELRRRHQLTAEEFFHQACFRDLAYHTVHGQGSLSSQIRLLAFDQLADADVAAAVGRAPLGLRGQMRGLIVRQLRLAGLSFDAHWDKVTLRPEHGKHQFSMLDPFETDMGRAQSFVDDVLATQVAKAGSEPPNA